MQTTESGLRFTQMLSKITDVLFCTGLNVLRLQREITNKLHFPNELGIQQ